MTTREQIVKQAQSWLGRNENDGSFKVIIDTYNADKPLPRGYAVKYTDEWCATFATAVAIKCGATDIIPKECSCYYMIQHFKTLGSWMETDSYVPAPGDYIFYDWDDNGVGEDTGSPEHVGIVEKVSSGTITVIEGNRKKSVARRNIAVNGRYIRGYGVPKYAATPAAPTIKTITVELPVLQKGMKLPEVKTLQRLLIASGYQMTSTDGKTIYKDDGSFGGATERALKRFQADRGLVVDGSCGPATWNALLK